MLHVNHSFCNHINIAASLSTHYGESQSFSMYSNLLYTYVTLSHLTSKLSVMLRTYTMLHSLGVLQFPRCGTTSHWNGDPLCIVTFKYVTGYIYKVLT